MGPNKNMERGAKSTANHVIYKIPAKSLTPTPIIEEDDVKHAFGVFVPQKHQIGVVQR